MTKEEAIKELSYIADEMPSMECRDWKEAICMVIKALEQECVFDKIKAEITDTEKCWYGVNDCFVKLSDVLKILDKYKAESEGKE